MRLTLLVFYREVLLFLSHYNKEYTNQSNNKQTEYTKSQDRQEAGMATITITIFIEDIFLTDWGRVCNNLFWITKNQCDVMACNT